MHADARIRSGLLLEAPGPAEATGLLDVVLDAEGGGLDAVWILGRAGVPGGALAFAAAVAEATERIRVAVGEPIGDALHPLRMAEDLAMIDIASAGRLDWIAGAEQDLERAREAESIVTRAWQGEPFSHAGVCWRFPELSCFPVPEQRPRPLVWRRGSSSSGVRFVADRADPSGREPSATLLRVSSLPGSAEGGGDVKAVSPDAVAQALGAIAEGEGPDWLIVSLTAPDHHRVGEIPDWARALAEV